MILGIGVDSIEISRVVKAMEKEHFVHRIFTEKERAGDGTRKKERCF